MGFKAKLFEVILYPESYEVGTLSDKLAQISSIKDWAYILHDKDDKKPHIHLVLRLKCANDSTYVAKWFNVSENAIEKCKGRWSDMLKYLTHENVSEKYQYSQDEVKSNFDWISEKDKGSSGDKRLQEIVSMIETEEIKQYNIHEKVTMLEYTKYKRTIDCCFEYRAKKLKGMNREMECVYIQGESGCGKTTYAKELARGKGYHAFVSSGSNDVLDGYEGEECIILDDLRPSCMGLSDLLKMLDNNTASTVKSRYRNKVLECRMIIITTVLPLEEFFRNVFENENEPIIQFKRRCQTMLKMDKDNINYYFYNQETREYMYLGSQPNTVYLQYCKSISKEEALEKLKKVLGGACQITETIKDNLEDFVTLDNQQELPFK